MSTNVEGINYGAATVLNGLTTAGGLSYVWAWDTTNLYVRFFDGVTAGGQRMAFYTDIGFEPAVDYQVPTSGFSYTLPGSKVGCILEPAATLGAGTINLPTAPTDRQRAWFSTTQTITSLTFSGGSATVRNAPTTFPAGTTIAYIYRAANSTWYVAP